MRIPFFFGATTIGETQGVGPSALSIMPSSSKNQLGHECETVACGSSIGWQYGPHCYDNREANEFKMAVRVRVKLIYSPIFGSSSEGFGRTSGLNSCIISAILYFGNFSGPAYIKVRVRVIMLMLN